MSGPPPTNEGSEHAPSRSPLVGQAVHCSGGFCRRGKTVSSVASGYPCRLARRAFHGAFRADPFGYARIRQDKSSGPPLLKPSLKMKRNGAHGQSSALVVATSTRAPH